MQDSEQIGGQGRRPANPEILTLRVDGETTPVAFTPEIRELMLAQPLNAIRRLEFRKATRAQPEQATQYT